MIADLKPYPEYKESGLPWLGELPTHWETRRAKRFLREVDERSQTGKEVLLSVSHLTGVTPRSEKTITMFLAKSNVGHKICRPDDVVINTLWAWMAALGVTKHAGIVSPAYGVYRPLAGCAVLPRYADHLLRTPAYAAEYQRRSTGVNSSRLRLYPEQFLKIAVVVPSHSEQAAIVRFLGWANGRLDRTIHAKRKVIALLNEQKQAIIHRAVTRGLDPTVTLKPSGIPWLGDIPQHWEVRRGKYLFQPIDVRSAKGEEELLTVSSSDGIVPRSTKTVMMFKAASYAGHKLCWPGDLVINSLWAWAKGLGFSSHHGIVSTAYGVYRPQPSYFKHALYWHELLRSPAYDWEFQTRSKGIWKSRLQLTDDSFLAMLIVVPPEEEAVGIVQRIRESTIGLTSAISRLEREIELLREYRTRLVADVVTGKLDVRDAAARLPDEVAPEAHDLGTELSDETEAADEEAVV